MPAGAVGTSGGHKARSDGSAGAGPPTKTPERIHTAARSPRDCMDALAHPQHHARLRVLPHVKKLDDALGDFIVRVTCPCGASRHIEPEALARIAGRSVT